MKDENEQLIMKAWQRFARRIAIGYAEIALGIFSEEHVNDRAIEAEYQEIRQKFLAGTGKIWFYFGQVIHLYEKVYESFEKYETLASRRSTLPIKSVRELRRVILENFDKLNYNEDKGD